jgi:hypothetical protein
LGLGVWVGGVGAGGLAPTPKSPIPNPQAYNNKNIHIKILIKLLINKIKNNI